MIILCKSSIVIVMGINAYSFLKLAHLTQLDGFYSIFSCICLYFKSFMSNKCVDYKIDYFL
jgi:hypothetical protein